MAKYTFRFHWRSWVDITVEADNVDDAYMLADDKYCRGDYEENPENFENTHTRLINKTE